MYTKIAMKATKNHEEGILLENENAIPTPKYYQNATKPGPYKAYWEESMKREYDNHRDL